jgi:FkbM family methyltransferase
VIPTDPAEVAEAQWAGLSGELAFDVGAHLGENFGHLRAAGCKRIVAFEPEPDLYRQLPGGGDVEAVCTAVGLRDGSLEMRRANGMLGHLTGDETVQSGCITLDSAAALYGAPDVVVVDVEGFEVQVVFGAAVLLDSRRASWLVEFHTQSLYHLVRSALEGAGYKPEVIRHPHYPAGSGLWRGHGWIKALRP